MPRRRKAMLFADVARLADHVRLGYPEATAQQGYTLYEVADPDHPRRSLLLLLGHHPRPAGLLARLARLFPDAEPSDIFQEVEVSEDPEAGTLHFARDGGGVPLRIRSRRHSQHLVELVELTPDPSASGGGGDAPTLLFLAAEPGPVGRLIRDSMALGNDRIQLAGAGPYVLARVERPSWFLVQRFLEEEPAVPLFYPLPEAGGRIWLRWGWRHPLAALWGQSESEAAGQRWLLFQPGQDRLRLDPPRWEDVYDTADLSLDFPSTAVAVQPVESPGRFPVPVRLAPRARPADPELWLLEEAERAELETLLLSLDEADLSELMVAVLQPAGGAAAAPRRYLLRERRTGEGRRLLDLPARGLAPWQGLADLFLPAELALEPRLRRDRYRALFGLGAGQLTLVLPGGSAGAPVEILRVPQSAFAPLAELVEFTLAAEAPRIEALRARDLFAFGPYAHAPARPDLFAPPARRPAAPRSAEATSPAEAGPLAPAERSAREGRSPPRRAEGAALPRQALTELQAQEVELERAMILSPAAASWGALAEVKAGLGHREDVAACALEALWLAEARDEAEAHARLCEALAAELGLSGSASQRCRQILQQDTGRHALAYAMHGRDLPEGQRAGWLETAERRLRIHEGLLTRKARWLAWGEVWRHNRDTRNQARVREQILQALDEGGVGSADIPRFILERLMADRTLDATEEGAEAPEVQRALGNLAAVQAGLRHLAVTPLQQGGMAALAGAWYRLGRGDLGQPALEQALRIEEPLAAAWAVLTAADAVASSAPEEAHGLRQRYGSLLERIPAPLHADLAARAEALQARRRDREADAFLSADNVARLFPEVASARAPALEAELRQLQKLRRENRKKAFAETAGRLLERIQKDPVDVRALSRILFLAVRELAAMQAHAEGGALADDFERFAAAMAKRGGEDEYFAAMTQISLARGLAELRRVPAATRMLQLCLRQVSQMRGPPLDVLDSSAALLRVVELLPLDQRASLLRAFFEVVGAQLHRLHGEIAMLGFLDLFDQACEAATSKDQLTLTRYRQYQDLDELIIRERILSEEF